MNILFFIGVESTVEAAQYEGGSYPRTSQGKSWQGSSALAVCRNVCNCLCSSNGKPGRCPGGPTPFVPLLRQIMLSLPYHALHGSHIAAALHGIALLATLLSHW